MKPNPFFPSTFAQDCAEARWALRTLTSPKPSALTFFPKPADPIWIRPGDRVRLDRVAWDTFYPDMSAAGRDQYHRWPVDLEGRVLTVKDVWQLDGFPRRGRQRFIALEEAASYFDYRLLRPATT